MMDAREWYVLQVTAGTEDRIIDRLINEYSVRAFSPVRILPELKKGVWTVGKKRMFPGYVFFQMRLGWNAYFVLSELPGAIRVLPGFGRQEAVPIEHIRTLLTESETGIWNISEGSIGSNGRAVVVNGPLLGHEDMILKWDIRRRRARIRMEMPGGVREFEVGLQLKDG